MAELTANRSKQAGAALLISAFTTAIGYVLATGITQYWLRHPDPDFLFVAKNYFAIQEAQPRLFSIINIVIVVCFVGGLALAAKVVTEKLTAFGVTRWMTKRDLDKKGFHADSRVGFVLGKTSGPEGKGRFIVSGKHPHVLLVAPTGRGKGVGFVIPNLLSYKGSAVVLDVKGENFEATARFRQNKMKHKIFRFSPRDFDGASHRYNPLERIKSYTNPAKRMAELEKVATLFLQSADATSESFLPNSREVFVACAILAYEQDNLTLGHIYKLAFGGAEPKTKFLDFAKQVKDRSARLLFEKLGNTTEKTLSAYLSVLSSAGMGPWANPHTCAVTDHSDFDFSTFRKKPQTVYFTVPADDITAIAPLVRLFFSDLIATLQHHEPGPDEPFPVLILLDEFQRIGKMQIIIDSISLLRSYRGNLAIVTQTIPNLDEVYGETSRKALQGGAGIKLYLTPSEEDTVKELSSSVGTTTKRIVSKSRTIGKDGIFGTNVSERTEEHPLLTPDQARRLPDDEVIIVVDADMPIRAKRIQYFDDHAYKELYESQNFSDPLPEPEHKITEADYTFIENADDRNEKQKALEELKAKEDAAARAKIKPEPEDPRQGKLPFAPTDQDRIKQISASANATADFVDAVQQELPLEGGKGEKVDALAQTAAALKATVEQKVASVKSEQIDHERIASVVKVTGSTASRRKKRPQMKAPPAAASNAALDEEPVKKLGNSMASLKADLLSKLAPKTDDE